MIFVKSVTTPKSTMSDDYLITPLKLTKGVIRNIELYFPVGNAGLHKVKMLVNELPLAPFNQGEMFIGDGVLLKYDMSYKVFDPPYELKIYSLNYDSVYEHSVQIRLNVKSIDEITEEQESILLLSRIKAELIKVKVGIEQLQTVTAPTVQNGLFRRRVR